LVESLSPGWAAGPECLARDAAAAAEAARAIIRRTAGLTGQIGVRDIKVARVAPAS